MMKFLKNYLLNSSYQLLLIILPLVTAPYISRVLGAKGVGINAFTNSIVLYFIIFAVLGTSTYGNREIAYHQNDKKARSDIFWGINFLSWITAGISLCVFIIFVLTTSQYQNIYLWQIPLILAQLFDISWYFMGMEKFKIPVMRNFFFKIVTVICIFIFVKQASDLVVYVAIMSLGNLIGSLSLWPYLIKEINPPRFKNLNLRQHLKYTLILFIPTIATSIYLVANKTMLGIFDSVTHAGFFNQSDTIIKMALSLVGTIGTVMLPRIANMHAQGDVSGIKQSIMKTFDIASGISFALFFGICGIALKFAPFFFGPAFSEVGIIMMLEAPIILFISWSGVFGGQYLVPLNRMKVFTFSVSFGAVVNILINFALIPFFGVIGAVIATVIAEFSVTAYQYWHIRDEFSIKDIFSGVWKYFLSGLVMFALVFWMNQSFKMTPVQLLLQVGLGGVTYVGMNIILNSNLWQMARQLLFKNKSEKGVEQDKSSIDQSIDDFNSLFSHLEKNRFSNRLFLECLDKLEKRLQDLASNPIDVEKNALLLSSRFEKLSEIFENQTENTKLSPLAKIKLSSFSFELLRIAGEFRKIKTQKYDLAQISELLNKEFGIKEEDQ